MDNLMESLIEEQNNSKEKLVKIEELNLTDQETGIIKNLLNTIFLDYDINEFYFMQINRGLSKAKKIAVKPHNLYPVIIKISDKNDILKEYTGYKNLKFRVNTSNLLYCEGVSYCEDIAGIAYHYVTKGRVRDTYDRLDTLPQNGDRETLARVVNIITNVFDYALKKSHFGHGLPKDIRKVEFSHINKSVFSDNYFSDMEKDEIIKAYNKIIIAAENIQAPFGTIHGDLHPKNILVGMNDIPILIDYNYVKSNECIYIDYAKLEVHMLTMLPQNITNSFFERKLFDRQYSTEPLILPRSEKDFLSSVVFEIRKILWKNCMSNNVGRNYIEIDKAYRAYLAHHFLRIAKKEGVSEWSRNMAYHALLNLGGIQ